MTPITPFAYTAGRTGKVDKTKQYLYSKPFIFKPIDVYDDKRDAVARVYICDVCLRRMQKGKLQECDLKL